MSRPPGIGGGLAGGLSVALAFGHPIAATVMNLISIKTIDKMDRREEVEESEPWPRRPVRDAPHPRRTRQNRSAQDPADRSAYGSSERGTHGQSRNAVSVAPQVAEGPASDVPAMDSRAGTGEQRPGCVTRVTYVRFGHTMLN